MQLRYHAALLVPASLLASGCTSILGDIDFDKHATSTDGSGGGGSSSSAGGGGAASSSTGGGGATTSSTGAGGDPCDGVTCSGNGKCSASAGEPACACDPGYGGLACDACVRYVTPAGAGSLDGLGWASAYGSLQDAIDDASLAGTLCEVWVAAGVYHAYDASPNGFAMKSDTALYGGFKGTENDRSQADPTNNETTLDGGDASHFNTANHVVSNVEQADVTLDGFTIQGGNARGVDTDASGGGLLVFAGGTPAFATMTVSRCEIKGNSASQYGGGVGVFSQGGTITFELTDSDIHDNVANYGGGGFVASQVTIERTSVHDNQAVTAGGLTWGKSSDQTTFSATDLTITDNVSSSDDGGLRLAGTAELTNLVVTGNTAAGLGAGVVVNQGSLKLENALIAGNVSAGYPGVYLDDLLPFTCVNCTITRNHALVYGADGLGYGTLAPTLINTILFGNGVPGAGVDVQSTSSTAPSLDHCDTGTSSTTGSSISQDPLFVSVPAFFDRTTKAASVVGAIAVTKPEDYVVGDVIEIARDGVSHLVTGTNANGEVTFDGAASSVVGAGVEVRNWGENAPGAVDYHLKSGSPCQSKGDAAQAPSMDLDGAARSGGADMGCY